MQYRITNLLLGFQDYLEISQDEYQAILRAKSIIVTLLEIELKFDLLIENYIELETSLFEIAVFHAVRSDVAKLRDNIGTTNRRVANLLSTARLYIDQVKHDLTKIDGTLVASAEKALAAEYDSRLGYRAMEALRNYVQHADLPIHRFGAGSGVIDRNQPARGVKTYLTIELDVEKLAKDGRFKAAVLKELANAGRHVALAPLLREYVEGLGGAHQAIRDVTQAVAEKSESLLASVLKRAEKWPDCVGVDVVAVDEEDEDIEIESTELPSDLIERRRSLVDRNARTARLSKRIVLTCETL